MGEFTFSYTGENGTVTVNFQSENWLDTFPAYLNMLRGAGYSVNYDTTMNVTGVSEIAFADRDFLRFNEEHSRYYYDRSRNK